MAGTASVVLVILLMCWHCFHRDAQAELCPKPAKIGSSYTIEQTAKNMRLWFKWEYYDLFSRQYEGAAVSYASDQRTIVISDSFQSSMEAVDTETYKFALTSGGILLPADVVHRGMGYPSSFRWKIDGRLVGHCDLEMYSLESSPMCTTLTKTEDHVTWTCVISHIYPPQAHCLFQSRKDNGKNQNVSSQYTDVTVFSSPANDSYGNTQCDMQIPIRSLSQGSYVFTINVYPGVSKTSLSLGKSLDSTLLVVSTDGAREINDWSEFGIAGAVLTSFCVLVALSVGIRKLIVFVAKKQVARVTKRLERNGMYAPSFDWFDVTPSVSRLSGLQEVNPSVSSGEFESNSNGRSSSSGTLRSAKAKRRVSFASDNAEQTKPKTISDDSAMQRPHHVEKKPEIILILTNEATHSDSSKDKGGVQNSESKFLKTKAISFSDTGAIQNPEDGSSGTSSSNSSSRSSSSRRNTSNMNNNVKKQNPQINDELAINKVKVRQPREINPTIGDNLNEQDCSNNDHVIKRTSRGFSPPTDESREGSKEMAMQTLHISKNPRSSDSHCATPKLSEDLALSDTTAPPVTTSDYEFPESLFGQGQSSITGNSRENRESESKNTADARKGKAYVNVDIGDNDIENRRITM